MLLSYNFLWYKLCAYDFLSCGYIILQIIRQDRWEDVRSLGAYKLQWIEWSSQFWMFIWITSSMIPATKFVNQDDKKNMGNYMACDDLKNEWLTTDIRIFFQNLKVWKEIKFFNSLSSFY